MKKGSSKSSYENKPVFPKTQKDNSKQMVEERISAVRDRQHSTKASGSGPEK